MQSFIYSDLAFESGNILDTSDAPPPEMTEYDMGFAKLSTILIDSEELVKKYERPIGRYLTVSTERIWLMGDVELDALSLLIGDSVSKLISSLLDKKKKNEASVLAVGIGNSEITPDSVGPRTVRSLTVTSHLAKMNKRIFESLGSCRVSAFVPGVVAQTGIETLELIQGATASVKPDIVVAVDALAARGCERLGRTVQITDTGLSPGCGIGNTRSAINKESIGVPVIAIGVPTIVDSATLVCDTLRKAGIEKLPSGLESVLDDGRSFFVSPKECDVICDSVSALLARSLDIAFSL
jgi:spore protease